MKPFQHGDTRTQFISFNWCVATYFLNFLPQFSLILYIKFNLKYEIKLCKLALPQSSNLCVCLLKIIKLFKQLLPWIFISNNCSVFFYNFKKVHNTVLLWFVNLSNSTLSYFTTPPTFFLLLLKINYKNNRQLIWSFHSFNKFFSPVNGCSLYLRIDWLVGPMKRILYAHIHTCMHKQGIYSNSSSSNNKMLYRVSV